MWFTYRVLCSGKVRGSLESIDDNKSFAPSPQNALLVPYLKPYYLAIASLSGRDAALKREAQTLGSKLG